MTAPKEVPWVVGLIAAMLAWTLTHIVDRLTSAPLISYQLECPLKTLDGPDGKPLVSGSFIVRNLTRETVFNNAHFQIYAGTASDPQGEIQAVGGSFIFPGENFQPSINKIREGGELVLTYDLPEMQPHQAWRLVFTGLQVSSPRISLRMSSPPRVGEPPPSPSEGSASTSPPAASPSIAPPPSAAQEGSKSAETLHAVQLVEADWQTFLVDHEIVILAVLACFFTVVFVVSLVVLHAPENMPPNGNEPKSPKAPPPVHAAAPNSVPAPLPVAFPPKPDPSTGEK